MDLCSIVGNILDNAIAACLDIPRTDRYINLSISCPNKVRFGIVASNSFNGKIKMDGEHYLSTHRGGSGIGLSIVKAIQDMIGQGYGVLNREDGVEFWFEMEAAGIKND